MLRRLALGMESSGLFANHVTLRQAHPSGPDCLSAVPSSRYCCVGGSPRPARRWGRVLRLPEKGHSAMRAQSCH